MSKRRKKLPVERAGWTKRKQWEFHMQCAMKHLGTAVEITPKNYHVRENITREALRAVASRYAQTTVQYKWSNNNKAYARWDRAYKRLLARYGIDK